MSSLLLLLSFTHRDLEDSWSLPLVLFRRLQYLILFLLVSLSTFSNENV